ncbi:MULTISPECIES: hypothetical protein [unclassified Microcoleus]
MSTPPSGASQFVTYSFTWGDRKKSGFFAAVCDGFAALTTISDFYPS